MCVGSWVAYAVTYMKRCVAFHDILDVAVAYVESLHDDGDDDVNDDTSQHAEQLRIAVSPSC